MAGTLTKSVLLDLTTDILPEQGNCAFRRGSAARASGLVVKPNASNPAYQVDIQAAAVNLEAASAFGVATAVSLTASMPADGANGQEKTANLVGTFSSSGTAVTGSGTAFLTDYQVGDPFRVTSGAQTGQARRITAIGSNTGLTLEQAFSSDQSAGTTHCRGGEAPNTWYGVYVIGDSTGVLAVASLLSVRSSSPTLPAGYDLSARVGSVRNDGSGDLVPFRQDGATVYFDDMQQVFSATADAGFTDRSPLVPAWASRAMLELRAETDGSATAGVSTLARRDGSSAANGCLRTLTAAAADQVARVTGAVPLVAGVVEIKSAFPSGASGTSSAHCLGWEEPFLAA